MISLLLIGGFLLLLFLGLEIGLAMLLPTLICLALVGYPIANMVKVMAAGVESFPLMAVPFFILAGNLMNVTGITDRIFNFAQALVGHIRGGLAQVNIIASMVFAGITGAAVADCAGLGTIELKAMTERGYDRAFSAAVSVASSAIGPIFPPSVIFVLYAILAEVSIARMFLAGVVPAVVICLILMLSVYLMARFGRMQFPVEPKHRAAERLAAFLKATPALMVPVIILSGMVWGLVTPTEVGVLAIVYSLILGFAYGDLKFSNLWEAVSTAMLSTAMILFIISVATIMGWIIAAEGLPGVIADFMLSLTENKYVAILLINIFLLILGCVLEGIPALLITVPLLAPLIRVYDIDPVHFGVVISLNLVIGLATPPVGVSLFIMARIANISIEEMVRAILPFFVPLLALLLVISYVPELSLALPNWVMGPAH